jgi:uncharacterized protein (DUF433 family)
MTTQIEVLTATETAVVAGVSVRDVNRIIDERILPETFYSTESVRSFRVDACALIAFYFQAADRLTSEERQRTILAASNLSLEWKSRKNCLIQDEFLTVNLSSFLKSAHDRLARLSEARDLVVMDEDVLGGTPVIKGTRVPVYDIAASMDAGISMKRILSAYPGLDEKAVELAALYAAANPQRGRRRRSAAPPAGAVIVSVHRRSRRDAA